MIPSCPCAGEPVDELPLSSDDQQRSLLPLLPPSHFTSLTLKSQRAVLPDTFPPHHLPVSNNPQYCCPPLKACPIPHVIYSVSEHMKVVSGVN